jgi:hypothetical protein
MSPADPEAHLRIRLDDIRADAMKAIGQSTNKIMGEASRAGALSGSRVVLNIDQAIEDQFRLHLASAAKLILQITQGWAQEHSHLLIAMAASLKQDILVDVERKQQARSAFDPNVNSDGRSQRLASVLDQRLDRILGDFKFGVVEGEKLPVSGPAANSVHIMVPASNSVTGVDQVDRAYDTSNGKKWLTLREAILLVVRASCEDGSRLADMMVQPSWAWYDHPTSVEAAFGKDGVTLFPKAKQAYSTAVDFLRQKLGDGLIEGYGRITETGTRRQITEAEWGVAFIHFEKNELQIQSGHTGVGRPFITDIQLRAKHILGWREESRHTAAPVFNINIGDTHMGDHFQDIQNATIVSRSAVDGSFNQIQNSLGAEVASTLRRVADLVNASGDKGAELIFRNFVNGLQQEKPDRGTLKHYWDSLVTLIPAIANIGTLIADVISKLGSS